LNSYAKQYPLGLANDTEAAIYNGNLSAIQGFIKRGLAEYKNPLQLILSGEHGEPAVHSEFIMFWISIAYTQCIFLSIDFLYTNSWP
jgi:hypothetical protein